MKSVFFILFLLTLTSVGTAYVVVNKPTAICGNNEKKYPEISNFTDLDYKIIYHVTNYYDNESGEVTYNTGDVHYDGEHNMLEHLNQDCSQRGGFFSTCGSDCDNRDFDSGCLAVCRYTCEDIGWNPVLLWYNVTNAVCTKAEVQKSKAA